MKDAEVLNFSEAIGQEIISLLGQAASFLKSKDVDDRMIYISLLTAVSSAHSSMFYGMPPEEIEKQLEGFVAICKELRLKD